MNRRQYLASTGLIAIPVAGCTTVGGETQLIAGDVIEDGGSVILPFSENGEDVLRIQFQKQITADEKREYYPFLWFRGNQTECDSTHSNSSFALHLTLRASHRLESLFGKVLTHTRRHSLGTVTTHRRPFLTCPILPTSDTAA
ncbi:hypothetical protein [Natrinema caseinilyticum]|uniref:hypothetical protein n=1 Tax=Natrinema caseinilyticum TaxID=2961570 RepID=UPI0020C208B6|nr:hypothetical protein [Natrinema caseinilyticum]